VGNGLARSFVTMREGVPVKIGWQIDEAGLTGLPDVPHDTPTPVYIAPLPAQATGTPLKFLVAVYASGHDAPNSEPGHFHVAFSINAPVQGTTAPFPNETAPVDPAEVPDGFVRVMLPSGRPEIVPGLGVVYDDPTQPSDQPALVSLGQNSMFYGGHMNAITLGPTIDFLASRQTVTEAIRQPRVYPMPGYYPNAQTMGYDPIHRMHVMMLEDFRRAPLSLP
jgi:hypothetical protein